MRNWRKWSKIDKATHSSDAGIIRWVIGANGTQGGGHYEFVNNKGRTFHPFADWAAVVTFVDKKVPYCQEADDENILKMKLGL